MGLPQESMMEDASVTVPYPAQTKQVAGEVGSVKTDVTSISFADKIMITITQDGRLAQWVRIYLISKVLHTQCLPDNGTSSQRQSDSI